MSTQLTPIANNQLSLGHLDLLGRLPVPLRRPFKTGLDRLVATASEGQPTLECCCLTGGEWYRPFDALSHARSAGQVPRLLITTLQEDIFTHRLLSFYRSAKEQPVNVAQHPAFISAGLFDPTLTFRTFAAVPFVFLVDIPRLRGRPMPSCWEDLLAKHWSGEIVFGGWRPTETSEYKEFNSFLLLSILHEFGPPGLEALARNVSHLQHNVRTATLFGGNSSLTSTIAILPWLHAEICPRRSTTRVIWPRDGALAMPIGYLCRQDRRSQLAPLIDYLTGKELAALFDRNCYPAARADGPTSLPAGAALKWPGWQYVYASDLASESSRAAQLFFAASRTLEMQACA